MSNQQIGLMLNRDIQFSYRDFAKDLLETCNYNPKVGDIPIDFKDPIYGDINPSFTDFVAPGVILTIVFFLAVALTSSALIVERMEGLLDRSWVAGVSPGEILFSHVVTQFVVMCGQTALVLDLHDPRLRRQVQRKHRLCHHAHSLARSLRHVLRFRDISRVRVGEERHTTGAGLLLPHLTAEWCHLAHRGHALGLAIHRTLSPSHPRHHLAPLGPHQRLASTGS
uniref:ABC transporter n=1 Tax=Papilio xuthus TaxID=66420 RepID=I4DN90_PAPXU|nr:ABC transporter [Papilio xuthus]